VPERRPEVAKHSSSCCGDGVISREGFLFGRVGIAVAGRVSTKPFSLLSCVLRLASTLQIALFCFEICPSRRILR
jgi:hypothetical protein